MIHICGWLHKNHRRTPILIIAQKVSLEETSNNSAFMNRIADIIETLVKESDKDSIGYKMAIVNRLLDHQKTSIVEREKIKANLVALQQGLKIDSKSQ